MIHSDSEQEDTPENIHSPSEIDEENSDFEKMENIFSTYCTQKKVSQHLWMDQPVEVVKALPYDIDSIKVYNVKADSRLQLLEAIKDGQKWKRDSRTDWAGYSSVRYKDCSGGFICPNTECLYF